jgi:integrase
MARVRDLWFAARPDSDGNRRKTVRHPELGGSKTASRYLALWFDTSGKEVGKAFPTYEVARRYAVKMEADAMRVAGYVSPRDGSTLLRDYAENRWLPAAVHLRSSSVKTYRKHLKNHILPAFGARRIGTLTKVDIKNFVAGKSQELAPTTVRNIVSTFTALMNSAVDDGLTAVNPCRRVKLPQLDAEEVEPLPAEALVALTGSMYPRYALMVWLGMGAGLRRGEAAGLTAQRVEHLRRRLVVRRQLQGKELVDVKSKASRRPVPVDDLIITKISAHMSAYEPGEHGLLITAPGGVPLSDSTFNVHWRRAVEAAGLPEGTRFHALRHTYASALIHAGVNVKVIQKRLGHSSIRETLDTYGHLLPDSEDLGRGAIETMIGSATTEQERNRGVR